jgi:hypothetical protein
MYRNNHDGTRDYKFVGKTGCPKCRGYGRIEKCPNCDGCGLILGKRCGLCFGTGVVAHKGRYAA